MLRVGWRGHVQCCRLGMKYESRCRVCAIRNNTPAWDLGTLFDSPPHKARVSVSVCGVRINYFSTSSLNAFEKLTCALWNCFDLRPGPTECICELLCIANVMYWGTTCVSLRVSRWNLHYSECFPRECVTTSIFHRLLANGKSFRKGGGSASFSISKHLQ